MVVSECSLLGRRVGERQEPTCLCRRCKTEAGASARCVSERILVEGGDAVRVSNGLYGPVWGTFFFFGCQLICENEIVSPKVARQSGETEKWVSGGDDIPRRGNVFVWFA